MNYINQITRILNAVFSAEGIFVTCVLIENDLIVMNFQYTGDKALAHLYNKAPGGYLIPNSLLSVGELSFMLTEPDEEEQENKKIKGGAFAYPDED